MSEDSNQQTPSQQATKINEPPVINTSELKQKRIPPKTIGTSKKVFEALWILMQTAILVLLTAICTLVYVKFGWQGVWKITLLGLCGLFAIMSFLVIIGGALDIRKLFKRLREQENKIES